MAEGLGAGAPDVIKEEHLAGAGLPASEKPGQGLGAGAGR